MRSVGAHGQVLKVRPKDRERQEHHMKRPDIYHLNQAVRLTLPCHPAQIMYVHLVH